jgi:NADPH-dependent ferric siderophore reductase
VTTTAQTSPALAFDVVVAAVVRLSPSYLRITFGGNSLAEFHPAGPLGTRDLRVKLLVPPPGRRPATIPNMDNGWYQRWLAMDPSERGTMRTYTVREARLTGANPQIDVDFVIHLDETGQGGPASTWAAGAEVGDPITIIGPNARSELYGGIEWQPPVAGERRPVQVLLAGDETAVPAIASVLESLPEQYRGRAILEVPVAEDFQMVRTAADVEITWLARDKRPHGELLSKAVRESQAGSAPSGTNGPDTRPVHEVDIDSEILWEVPEPTQTGDAPFYAWIAGEAAVVRDLRRHLVRELGVDRRRVAFMGYWRLGRPETP